MGGCLNLHSDGDLQQDGQRGRWSSIEGLHRAHKLDVTLDPYHGKFRLHFLPAHCGHHLNPIEGFWRVMKNAIGAGRCFQDLVQLYKRTRHVLMAHQERPIYAFPLAPHFPLNEMPKSVW